ncbi:MAG: YtxH domain-containing protein, partial [Spirosoma sp.]|nr:YtxH domain-containing protein [Spirosoma sp.]
MASSRDFIIGTLTGLTIGYLSAPQTGKASRKWLKNEFDKRANSGSGLSGGSDWQEQLKTIFEKAKA